MGDTVPEQLDIPTFLKRDANNKAEFMMSESVDVESESRPAKSAKAKANGAAPVKAAGKAKAKAVAKAPAKAKTAPKATAKAAKAPAKVAKPKAESKVERDAWGFRKGSAKSDAVAMYSRKSGATLSEVKDKVGSIQLNVLNALEADGHKVERKKEERKGQRPATRYFLTAKK